jgi:hypothetical protein
MSKIVKADLETHMEDNIQSIFERSEAEFEYYVKYSIYFPETASSIENLHQISAEIRALAEQITGEYLWQKDRFGISITQSSIRGKITTCDTYQHKMN